MTYTIDTILRHGFSVLFINSVSFLGFPGGSGSKESACNAGDPGLIPGSGRFPREEKAPHSREVPWIEEPGGLPSMVSQRVRHS